MLIASTIFMVGCSKEKDLPRQNESAHINAESRSTIGLDTAWLTDFQTYIKNIRDNNVTTNSFTLNEVVYGTETLINIKHSRYPADSTTTFVRDTINFNTGTSDYYDLFSSAKSFINSSIQEKGNTKIVGFDLKIDTFIGNLTRITTTTIFSGGLGVSRVYDPCDIFDDGESYYVGVYEIDPDEPSTFLDCYNNGYGSCLGGLDSEGNMLTTAISRLQSEMNFHKPGRIVCEGGKEPIISGYTDFNDFRIWTDWPSIENENNCTNSLNSTDGVLESCDCIEGDELNDTYYYLDSYIDNELTDGYQFMSINLGGDFIPNGDPEQELNTALYGFVYEAKPFCITKSSASEAILKMDLNDDGN